VQYPLRKAFHGLLLVLGVTFISFVLMVWFGPDQTYTLIGKNATAEQISEVRRQLGYDQPLAALNPVEPVLDGRPGIKESRHLLSMCSYA